MAEVMTPAQPYKNPEIAARENAIKAKLLKWNQDNLKSTKTKLNAQVSAYAKKKPPAPKVFSKEYSTQVIKGPEQGFSQSDYGAEQGAAIPYQIGNERKTASTMYTPAKKAAIVKRLGTK